MDYYPPWVVSADYILAQPQTVNPAWKRMTRDVYILEHRIETGQYAELPPEVAECYRPVYAGRNVAIADGVTAPAFYDTPKLILAASVLATAIDMIMREDKITETMVHSWWIRLENVPRSERVRWPELTPELNLKEIEGLMEFVELYEWVPSKFRFVLREKNKAWAVQQ